MRPWHKLLPAPHGEARHLFMLAIALNGPVYATLQFGEVIARKSLMATGIQITLLVMTMPLANFTALWWGRLLEGRDQRKWILVTGIIGNLSLMTGLWVESMAHLILSFAVYYLTWTVVMTGQNRLLQQHVSTKEQGGLFGLSNGIRVAVAAVFASIAGIWMDSHTGGFRHVIGVAGIFGLATTLIYAVIPTKSDHCQPRWRPTPHSLLEPIVGAFRLFKRRPDYLRFEIAFMIYGVAFMMMLPVVPVFLVDDLQLDYTTIGFSRGMLFQLLMIPSIWLFGRWFDRKTPHQVSSVVFFLLSIHPLLLILAWALPGTWRTLAVFAAFAVYGVAMGGVSIVWSVGSVRFARNEDAGVYQGVHIAMTGIRGSFAPVFGYLIMEFVGTVAALLIASGLWFISSIFMLIYHRKDGCGTFAAHIRNPQDCTKQPEKARELVEAD